MVPHQVLEWIYDSTAYFQDYLLYFRVDFLLCSLDGFRLYFLVDFLL